MKKDKTTSNWLQKSRESWANTGTKRPPFAIKPKKGQRSVWDFPRPPIIEKVNDKIVVNSNGIQIAMSNAAFTVLETASPPTYYLEGRDIDMDTLVMMQGKTSLCEWKGKAIYFALKTDVYRPVAWSYPNPFPGFKDLKNCLAFYPQHLECYVNDNQVKAQESEFYAGWITPDLTGPFKGEKGTEYW